MGQGYRHRSPESIVKEMRFLYNQYGVKYFHFTDDEYVLKKKFIYDFCNKVKKEFKNSITWGCAGRVNLMTEELIATMVDAGCVLIGYGIEDLVLDPGTFSDKGLDVTINNLTMLRRLSCKIGDELLGFPLIGTPITAWTNDKESPDSKMWDESYLASMLVTRYADILVLHSLEGWVLLPLIILRDNLYTDPRKPISVKAGLRTFGKPNENSPVLMTSNFALTYFTVASDIEKIDCYLIVIDTEGNSVESAVAGRKLTSDKVGEAIKSTGIETKVKHKKLIIPGRAARISGEIEEASGWDVIVGSLDSSGIPAFLHEKWQEKKVAQK